MPALFSLRSGSYGRTLGAWNRLVAKVARLDKSPPEAALEFNAMLEGLADAELRGAVLGCSQRKTRNRPAGGALATVARGFGVP